jgi:hypothetical protein
MRSTPETRTSSSRSFGDAAVSFLLGQTTAFEEFRQTIADAFEHPVVDTFLNSLSVSGIRVGDFDAVLAELSNMLGGAYRRGRAFFPRARLSCFRNQSAQSKNY